MGKPYQDKAVFTQVLDEVDGVWTAAAEVWGCDERTVRRYGKIHDYHRPTKLQPPLRKLLIDIETSPNVADVWSLWNDFISLDQLRQSTRVICFAARFMDKKTTFFRSEYHHGREKMLATAYELLCKADALVHYNGKKFDTPHLHREFVLAGFTPPPPVKEIDLLDAVKKNFRFTSNKLQHVAKELGIGQKVEHEGHLLWVRCLAGDKRAWARMKKYNIQDVQLLEDLYLKLRPWILNHPHEGLYTGEDECCPNCGSTDLSELGYARTAASTYKRYQCQDCGRWIRSNRRESGVKTQGAR